MPFQALFDIVDSPRFSAFYNHPELQLYVLQAKSYAHDLLGNPKQADEFAQQTIEAYLELQSASSGSDMGDADILSQLASTYAQTGELAKALETVNQACTLIPESRDSLKGANCSQTRVLILAMSGNRDEALLEIERLLSIPAGFDRWLLYLDPTWDFFRDDERFNELVRPLNLTGEGL